MPFNPNRPQSGMFDSHGDGHPPQSAYVPTHTGCEPVSEAPEDGQAPEAPADAEGVA
ncbi:hypothetical protein ACWGKU_02065 [Kitasatospora sp. NPDC054768]